MLVGIGQDSHRFKEGNELILAGVKIENHPGLDANSDGDVVYHALVNAISSALGKGSISYYADELCEQGIKDSSRYVLEVKKHLGKHNVNNISIAIEAKTPKIEPIVDDMKKNISKLLDVSVEKIGITVTSGEGLTAFGKKQGIQVFCIVSII